MLLKEIGIDDYQVRDRYKLPYRARRWPTEVFHQSHNHLHSHIDLSSWKIFDLKKE